MSEAKSGSKSTEFYLILVISIAWAIVGALVAAYPNAEAVKIVSIIVGGIVTGLGGAGYAIGRSYVKGKAAENSRGSASPFVLIILVLVAVAFMIISSGCGVNETYVKASDQTYNQIAPDYLKYLEADTKRDKDEIEAKKLVLSSWRSRIDRWKEYHKDD